MFKPNSNAVEELEFLMIELSEIWCATWMSGVEFALWDAVQGQHNWAGQVTISEEEIAIAKQLSQMIQGWVMWPDDWDKPGYVPMEAWRERWREWHTQTKPSLA